MAIAKSSTNGSEIEPQALNAQQADVVTRR